MNPLVSIIIPSYNREKLLTETLNSVLNQTYKNWECIIIDDRSTDNTLDVINSYATKDSRFRLILKPNEIKNGASISRNIGLKESKGSYIQFLDSDDIIAENKLEEQIKKLSSEDKFSIATCKWGLFQNKEDEFLLFENNIDYRDFTKSEDYFDIIGLKGGFFPPHVFLISKELIDISGYWNEELTMNDDGEFFFRVLSNSKKILFADSTYVKYRTHSGENLSMLNSLDKAKSLIKSWMLIESLYLLKYKNTIFLDKKKESVYFEIKRTYPKLIKENKLFFKKQLKADNLFLKATKLKRRILKRLKIIFSK
ncbi:MAG: hypothetical protein COA67_00555 [Lutibacter sp.]|nr:MAG: hypothetical protein COA67_00555 [Lutibacter sp.]